MGYIYLLAQGAITWSSKMQRSISTSTTEAEYHALAYAGKEAVWIRNLLQQLGQELFGPNMWFWLWNNNCRSLRLLLGLQFLHRPIVRGL